MICYPAYAQTQSEDIYPSGLLALSSVAKAESIAVTGAQCSPSVPGVSSPHQGRTAARDPDKPDKPTEH